MSFKIKKIDVWGLFDCYDYLGITLENGLVLFYGENGIGKTTVIKIIFEFLSMNFYQKNSLTKGLYNKLQIEFENETIYEVEGSMFRVYHENKVVYEYNFENDCSLEMLEILENINNEVLYITDNKELINITPEKKIIKRDLVELVKEIESQFINSYIMCMKKEILEIDEIFYESIRRLSNSSKSQDDDWKNIKKNSMVLDNNKKMEKYKLINFNNDTRRLAFNSNVVESDSFQSITDLLQFYYSYKNNHGANLETLFNRIDILVSEVNSYLVDKKLDFDIENGFCISQNKTKKKIKIEWLSSGETNLLRILFSCMLANDKSGIFFIDEPELSLNMRWLERIERSLQRIACSNKDIQFIICTHSFDIISQDMDKVYKFEG